MTQQIHDGGRAVAHALAAADVTTIFTLHGGHLDSIYRGCLDHGLKLIDVRHEACAGHAAEAWARLRNEIGVCMITAGPGFTNAITSITNAWLDGVPVLYLIGAPPLREAGLNVLQGGIDQIAMAKPITKLAVQITDPDRIADQIATAISVARSGRPGPVLVELPIDVLARPCTVPVKARRPVLASAGAPSAADVETALTILQAAERPVLVLGGLARYQLAPAQIARFLEITGVPVVSSQRAMGLVDPALPNYAHGLDSLAVASATGAGAADAALLLGARHGLFMGGRSEAFLAADCRLVHVHADAFQFSAVRVPELASTADCGLFLEALSAAWTKPASANLGWRNALAQMPEVIDSMFEPHTASGRPHPYFAARAVIDHCPADSIFVTDGGENSFWVAYHMRSRTPGGVLSFGQLGALGTGMGMAIGAQVAMPARRVVHLCGDGAIGFNLQEFDTMARHRLPVVSVIFNNSAWGMSLHGQQLLYGEHYDCVSKLPDIAYEKVAAALGCHMERVHTLDELAPAMARAFASGRPACINVDTAAEIMLPATAAMLGDPAPGEVMVPYYENIPA